MNYMNWVANCDDLQTPLSQILLEGYGRNNYKGDFIRFLTYSQASCDETVCHLSKINRLYPELSLSFKEKTEQYKLLEGKINNFIKYVQLNWRT
ncbi:four helix bundle protein [Chryseobacterium sp. RRHN12]|uniref:four helix bundle protein n=1 Tax=Chryseobacterium sp. RRHN12 TaxID=3437884 RepID=UPI003D9B939C